MVRKKVRAHTNIALIKYWGKKNEELILPLNNSLSLTLDAFYTETSVEFDSSLEEDVFYLDGEKQAVKHDVKVNTILDLVRERADIQAPAYIESMNHVPTAAGLASSASGLAALAGAASLAAGLDLSPTELSRLARRGSGSASRSIYGGFAEWLAGDSDETSYAVPVDEADWDIGMIFILLNREKKKISSRDGMKLTVETSPFMEGWVRSAATDLKEMKEAIANKDFTELGKITERSASRMHATTLGAREPFSYLQPESLQAIRLIQSLREEDGLSCYFTMDAGPNVKVLCRLSESRQIQQALQEIFGEENVVISKVGPGIKEIDPE